MAKRVYHRNGTVRWLDDKGRSHREDGPATVWPHGTQYWLRHGRAHFAHGPADLYYDGTLRWYEDGRHLRWRDPYG